MLFVCRMKELASKYGCLFADLFSLTEGCTWLLHDDHCHYTDVGKRVLGQIIFTAIILFLIQIMIQKGQQHSNGLKTTYYKQI